MLDVLYYKGLDKNLKDYGINVPIVSNRASSVFSALKESFPDKVFATGADDIIPLSRDDLLAVHSREFVDGILSFESAWEEVIRCYELEGIPAGGEYKLRLYKLVEETLKAAAGSYHAMERALTHGLCYYLSGGMHHARSDRSGGFCLVNDIVIGIRKLQHFELVKNVWVIDVDAHKGDGTAEICHQDPSIQTLSIHMAAGWPMDLGDNTYPSDIDIAIEEGGEGQYLNKLERGLGGLSKLEAAEIVDIAVVVGGVDPYCLDTLPSAEKLKLDKQTMLERDLMIFNFLKDRNIPQCWLAAGGYGPESSSIYCQFLHTLYSSM